MGSEVARINGKNLRRKSILRSKYLRRGLRGDIIPGAFLSHSKSNASSTWMLDSTERPVLTIELFCGVIDNACLLTVL